VLPPLTTLEGASKHEERITMSKQKNAIAVRTIGIDTGKNTLHMIGLDERGEVVLREKSPGTVSLHDL
jgi:hypothetical protein